MKQQQQEEEKKPDELNCYCCTCPLKTGTTIPGWIGALLTVVILVKFLQKDPEKLNEMDRKTRKDMIFVAGISIFIHMLLLFGAHRERPAFMVPYLIFIVIILAAITSAFISSVAKGNIFSSFVDTMLGIAVYVISTYFLVISYKYYQYLKKKPPPEPKGPAPEEVIRIPEKDDRKLQFSYENEIEPEAV